MRISDLELTMLPIPGGRFLMGSPEYEPERFHDEGPQHKVTLATFWIAQTPITQAQWNVVAGLEKVERELNANPSNFKGPDRPVESVSWPDAIEFCRRLSKHTRRNYTLPSEAQWEYACRAGTTTPFHFGDTLTPQLASSGGWTGTSEVASFPANDWGLRDMHGNVWEWCEDHWHDSYNFAPGDDQPWLIPTAADDEPRLLRGGSWGDLPRLCRSAYRDDFHPDPRFNTIGFRVCCLPTEP